MAEQSVSLNPSESRLVSFEAIPHEAKVYHVSVNGLTGSFAAIAPPFYWLLPTGHRDPENRWENEPAAYDGHTDTYAEVWASPQTWTGFIEFTIDPTNVSAIRHWGSTPISPKHCDVDVEYDGAWHHIYEDGFGARWTEIEIPDGVKLVSKARMRFYNNSRTRSMRFRLHEFQFFGYAEAPPPPPPPPPPPVTTKLYGYVTDKITGAPIAGAVGTVYQEYDTKGADYDLVTDSQGYYLIDNMTPDAVLTQMVIYATGYKTYTNENVSISEGDNQLNVRMYPE